MLDYTYPKIAFHSKSGSEKNNQRGKALALNTFAKLMFMNRAVESYISLLMRTISTISPWTSSLMSPPKKQGLISLTLTNVFEWCAIQHTCIHLHNRLVLLISHFFTLLDETKEKAKPLTQECRDRIPCLEIHLKCYNNTSAYNLATISSTEFSFC